MKSEIDPIVGPPDRPGSRVHYNFHSLMLGAFKKAYSYTGGVEFSFFNAQSVKECVFVHAPSIKEWKL